MKDVKILNRGRELILSLLLIACSTLFGQNVVNMTLRTGFTGNDTNQLYPFINPHLSIFNDSMLLIRYGTSDSLNLINSYNFTLARQSDLSNYTTVRSWKRDSLFVPIWGSIGEYGIESKILNDKKNSSEIIYDINFNPNDSDFTLNFYTIKNLIQKDSLFLSIPFRKQKPSVTPYIQDSTIIFITSSSQFLYTIYSFNFSGQILSQRVIDFNNFILNDDFSVNLVDEITGHYSNDSLIILHLNGLYSIVVLNRYSLNTRASIFLNQQISIFLLNSFNYTGASALDYVIDSTGVHMGAYSHRFIASNIVDDQIFSCKLNWDSTLVYFKTFGDSTTDERAYAYTRSNNSDYLIGTFPSSPLYPYAAAYKKNILLKSTNSAIDSIHFFGNKNHTGIDIVVNDNNGDVFFLSTFSEAWSNDSIFLQITKVPNAVLTSLDKIPNEKKNRKVIVYPNPTSQFLHSSDFQIGDEFSIYDLRGRLVREDIIKKANQINMISLNNGTYILRLNKYSGTKSTIFMKTD